MLILHPPPWPLVFVYFSLFLPDSLSLCISPYSFMAPCLCVFLLPISPWFFVSVYFSLFLPGPLSLCITPYFSLAPCLCVFLSVSFSNFARRRERHETKCVREGENIYHVEKLTDLEKIDRSAAISVRPLNRHCFDLNARSQ